MRTSGSRSTPGTLPYGLANVCDEVLDIGGGCVAAFRLTMKFACISETRAPPIRVAPSSPHDSMSRAAWSPGGLRNTLPAFDSPSGCVATRRASNSLECACVQPAVSPGGKTEPGGSRRRRSVRFAVTLPDGPIADTKVALASCSAPGDRRVRSTSTLRTNVPPRLCATVAAGIHRERTADGPGNAGHEFRTRRSPRWPLQTAQASGTGESCVRANHSVNERAIAAAWVVHQDGGTAQAGVTHQQIAAQADRRVSGSSGGKLRRPNAREIGCGPPEHKGRLRRATRVPARVTVQAARCGSSVPRKATNQAGLGHHHSCAKPWQKRRRSNLRPS